MSLAENIFCNTTDMHLFESLFQTEDLGFLKIFLLF